MGVGGSNVGGEGETVLRDLRFEYTKLRLSQTQAIPVETRQYCTIDNKTCVSVSGSRVLLIIEVRMRHLSTLEDVPAIIDEASRPWSLTDTEGRSSDDEGSERRVRIVKIGLIPML